MEPTGIEAVYLFYKSIYFISNNDESGAGQEGGEALMKMEGEVLVLPPCFESVGLGKSEPRSCISRWPFAHLFLFMVLYLFAVTSRWFVVSQPYSKMLRVLGCLGVLFRLLTVITIKEPGGQLRFSFQLFTFPKLLVVLAAGRWYSCFIL